ncbi:MAG: cupredoxin domain-containing protein [Chloroflexi bacterium]|nr:cupredoxin domain-containing protein [Chloroflexota bacterium]
MRPIRLALLAAVAVLAAACSSGSSTPAPVTAAPVPSVEATAATTRIDVTLNDALTIEPAAMTVPAGVPVTFVVTNTGAVFHEFVLGDEAEQMAHDAEMMESGGMSMPQDEPMAIGLEPGQTKELTVTLAEPGEILAGCHVVGHYAAGMKAAITIE